MKSPFDMRSEILAEAETLVNGDRNVQYGDPNVDFKRTAGMWSAYLGVEVAPGDVGWMMAMLKASRNRHQKKRDNYADAIGYVACAYGITESGGDDTSVATHPALRGRTMTNYHETPDNAELRRTLGLSIRNILRSELGHEQPFDPHSWRCADKVRYPGPCGCADEVADMAATAAAAGLLDALRERDALLAERDALVADADHWQPQAVDRVVDELARVADESQHEGWDTPTVRRVVDRLRAALDEEAQP